MLENYNVVYTKHFIDDVKSVASYISNKLKNKDAAIALVDTIEKEINKKRKSPMVSKPYYYDKNDVPVYYIKIRNFYAFYTVKKEEKIMQVEIFVYARRDISNML